MEAVEEKAVRRVRTIRGAIRYGRNVGTDIIPAYLLKLRGANPKDLYIDLDGRIVRRPQKKTPVLKPGTGTRKRARAAKPVPKNTKMPRNAKEYMQMVESGQTDPAKQPKRYRAKPSIKSISAIAALEVKAIRHVRTPSGVARFKQPIGSVIFTKPDFSKLLPKQRAEQILKDFASINKFYQDGVIKEKDRDELSKQLFASLGLPSPKGNTISKQDIERIKEAVNNLDKPEAKKPAPKKTAKSSGDASAPKTRAKKTTKPAGNDSNSSEDASKMSDEEFLARPLPKRVDVTPMTAEQALINNRRRERIHENRGVREDAAKARTREIAAKENERRRTEAEMKEKKRQAVLAAKEAERIRKEQAKLPKSFEDLGLVRVEHVGTENGVSRFATPDGERLIQDGKITLSDGTDVTGDYKPESTDKFDLARALNAKHVTRGRAPAKHTKPTSKDAPSTTLYKGQKKDIEEFDSLTRNQDRLIAKRGSDDYGTAHEFTKRVRDAYNSDPEAGRKLLGDGLLDGAKVTVLPPDWKLAVREAIGRKRTATEEYKKGSVARSRARQKPNVTANNSKFADRDLLSLSVSEVNEYIDEAKNNPELHRARVQEVRDNLSELGINAKTAKTLLNKTKRLADKYGIESNVSRGRPVGAKDSYDRASVAGKRTAEKMSRFPSDRNSMAELKKILGYQPDPRKEYYGEVISPDGTRSALIRRKVDGMYQGFDPAGKPVTLAYEDPARAHSEMAKIAGLRSGEVQKPSLRRATEEEIAEIKKTYKGSIPENASIVWVPKKKVTPEMVDRAYEDNKISAERSKSSPFTVEDDLFAYINGMGDAVYVKPKSIKNTIEWDKWERNAKVSEKIATLRRRNMAILKEKLEAKSADREMQIATVSQLMQEFGIRVGSSSKSIGAVESFGATQLLKEHLVDVNGVLHLRFVGKSGMAADYEIGKPNNSRTAQALAFLKDSGSGDRLFPDATDTRTTAHARSITGIKDMKNHDLRTTYANTVMQGTLEKLLKENPEKAKTTKGYNALYLAAEKVVAEGLNDKLATARDNYISPFIKDRYAPKAA